MSLLDHYDALLFDLDGTVWESGRPIGPAVEVINAASPSCWYITNNASRPPEQVATMLGEMGIQADASTVLTSAQAAVALAANKLPNGAKVLVLGSASFQKLASDAGFEVVHSADDSPAAVLHGHDPETGWAQLSEAALAIHAGALYLASNLDTSLPTPRGLCVGNGSMVAAVVSATGVQPEAAGKPEPAMFVQAAQQASATRPLAIGDRLDTDIAGAVGADMDALMVLTGVSGLEALLTAPPSMRPTFVGEDLGALLCEPEALRPGPHGGFVAQREEDSIVLRGGSAESTRLDALLTLVGCAWESGAPCTGAIRASGESAMARLAELGPQNAPADESPHTPKKS